MSVKSRIMLQYTKKERKDLASAKILYRWMDIQRSGTLKLFKGGLRFCPKANLEKQLFWKMVAKFTIELCVFIWTKVNLI